MQVWFSNATRIVEPIGESTAQRTWRLLSLLLLSLLVPTALAQTLTEPASPFGESRFLPAEQAFSWQVSIDSEHQLTLTWQVAPGYYMYQDKFRFVVAATEAQPGQALHYTMNDAIAHSDEFFGDVMVHRNLAIATIRLPAGLPEEFMLQIEYQGCADAGLCYPLQRDEVPILR